MAIDHRTRNSIEYGEKMRALVQSRHWDVLQAEIEEWIEDLHVLLEGESDFNMVRLLQGNIESLRNVLGLKQVWRPDHDNGSDE